MFSLFWTFLKIGAFTFGGGYAMLSMVETMVCRRKAWLSQDDFDRMASIVPGLPGIFAVNMALYVGSRVGGRRGSVLAALGAILPSMIIILCLAMGAAQFKDNPHIERVFMGLRPAVVALILCPACQMMQRGLTFKELWMPLLAVILIVGFQVSPTYIVLGALVWGVLLWRYDQRKNPQT